MMKIRIKAYLIDFLVLFLMFILINLIFPKTEYLTALEMEQNTITENYMSGRISFSNYVEDYGNLYYESSMEQYLICLIYMVFMIIYFVVVPFVWKGRTLGCYLCGVQIERFDQGKLELWHLLVRYSIVFGMSYIVLNNVLILFLPSNYYFPIISLIAVFQFVIAIFCAITVLCTKEKRGFHELITNTELTKIIERKKKKGKMKKKRNTRIK